MAIAIKTALLGLLSIVALSDPTHAYPQRSQLPTPQGRPTIPSFKVAGRDSTALSIAVPPDTTEAQLAALVNNFRAARMNGTLAKLIPATTPKGSRGPHGIVMIFVFSDPAWATSERLHAFINNPRTSGISSSDKTFGQKIRAYYYYTALGPHEIGSIGHEDYTSTYKRLF